MTRLTAAEVTRGSVEVDGIDCPLLQAGPADATEAVVFLHGNPGSSEDWRAAVGAAGTFARAVAIDQPGFGKAGKPSDFDHTYTGHAEHLARVFDRLGIERAHVVGHDLGGRWMLDWAAKNPDRFASAVIVAGGVLLDYRWHYLARIWRMPVIGELFMKVPSRRLFRLILRRGNPRGLPRDFVDRMYDDMNGPTRQAIITLYRPSFDWNARSYELSRELGKLDRPVKVIWGRADPYIPVAQAERQRDTFPGADITLFDRSGHWPFMDDPERFEETLVPFLRSVLAGRRDGQPA
jgi:pimeloyl-ACP methyl ester carboxylesterase